MKSDPVPRRNFRASGHFMRFIFRVSTNDPDTILQREAARKPVRVGRRLARARGHPSVDERRRIGTGQYNKEGGENQTWLRTGEPDPPGKNPSVRRLGSVRSPAVSILTGRDGIGEGGTVRRDGAE